MELPPIGTRISLSGHLGTIRYVGSVDNALGIWLGVEWDDPSRGKHNGTREGKRYFSCRTPNAGSFIRLSASISFGISFLQALYSKYVEEPHGSAFQEKVILGSSNGAIEVEAVQLDKIRRKLARLENLREISLDDHDVAKADPPGFIRNTCPDIRGLDLSRNLIANWDIVAAIAAELPLLQVLTLNRNRMQLPDTVAKLCSAFTNLRELRLNATLITWTEMEDVITCMPNLLFVEMGYNQLSRLSSATSPSQRPRNSLVQVFNLDSNNCDDWRHVCESLRPYTSLQQLVLVSNGINGIPFLDSSDQVILGLLHLSLSYNSLNVWSDIDAISAWCPDLQTLALAGNPLTLDYELAKYSRQFTIARIPSLTSLDGTPISTKERLDSELFYISHVVQNCSDDLRNQEHPRWRELCIKHGIPPHLPTGKEKKDRLSNRLIELDIYQCFTLPNSNVVQKLLTSTDPVKCRVLPSMPLRAFRTRVGKFTSFRSMDIRIWLVLNNNTTLELLHENDNRDLAWIGIEHAAKIIFLAE